MNNLKQNIVTNSPVPIQDEDNGFDYTADVWSIEIPRMNEEPYILNFNERFGELRSWQKQVAKAYVFSTCQQYKSSLTYPKSRGNLKSTLGILRGLFMNLNSRYADKLFSELSDFEVVEILATDAGRNLRARGTIEQAVIEWNKLFDMQFNIGSIIDRTLLPSKRAPVDWEKICIEHLAPEDFDATEWLSGGTFNKVPFEVSLALLCFCVETLKSDKTKYLLAWSKWQREYQTKRVDTKASNRILNNFGRNNYYRNAKVTKQIDAEYFECLQHYYPDAQTHSDLPFAMSNEGPIPFNFDNTSGNSFVQNVQHLVCTCYVALLILAGARRSELESIRTDGIRKKGDYYIFTTPIEKTHHGVEKPRTIGSFLIPEILSVLDQISIEPLDSENREMLFGYSLRPMSGDNARERKSEVQSTALNQFYEKFLKTEGEHLREICDHINPHGFRHTWVEFALRRFDGNIMPLIMDRLAHTGQHKLTFTPTYTDNKISMSEYKKLGKEWMVEIVRRYVDEPDVHAVFGAVGDKIRNLVDDLNILDLQNEYERDERVHEVVDEVFPDNILKPSETIICCLREGRQRYAQCYNSKTGVAMTSMAKTPQCCACEMSLICQSQLTQLELTLEEYEERYQQHQLGALANRLRAEANEDNPFGTMFAEQARKDYDAMKAFKERIDKIRGSK